MMPNRFSLLAAGAIAALTAFSPVGNFTGLVQRAEAAVNVSVNFGVFYDRLGDYGDWTNYNGRYVFVPDVGPDWRPYTVGHWAYTRRYGWMWISEEPFGWAAYHYGRWGFDEDLGWYWVPGRRWAPAWVSWRRTPDHLIWAPLPPSDDYYNNDYSGGVNVSVNVIPDYYWVAVPSQHFLDPNLSVNIIFGGDNDHHGGRHHDEYEQVFRRSEPVGNVKVVNNVVVNNVVNVDYVEKETKKKVRALNVRETDRPNRTRVQGNDVEVFAADVSAEGGNAQVKPKKVRDVSQVKQERSKVLRQRRDQNNGDQQQTTAPDNNLQQGGATDQQLGNDQNAQQNKKNRNVKIIKPGDTQENTGSVQPPRNDKKSGKQLRQQQQQQQNDNAVQQGQNQPEGQQIQNNRKQNRDVNQNQNQRQNKNQQKQNQKQKNRASQPDLNQDQGQPNLQNDQQGQNGQNRKLKRNQQQNANQPGQDQGQPQGKSQGKNKRKSQDQNQGCDPAASDCPPSE